MLLHQLHPQILDKVSMTGGGLEWSNTVPQLVLEMLTYCTPPSYISYNILSVYKFILPNFNAIHQLPGVEFICFFRGTISCLTKLLASNELARSPKFLDHNVDGTARLQKEFQNDIVRISKEGSFNHVTLDSYIMYVDGTGEMVRDRILRSFQTGRQMIDRWRDLTSRMYPNWPELLTRIPQANGLTISNLDYGGCVKTDSCNATRKYCRLLVESIKQIAEEEGIPKERIQLFEAVKVITNFYIISFSTLILRECNFFTIL